MSASLVGSEMCIRDRYMLLQAQRNQFKPLASKASHRKPAEANKRWRRTMRRVMDIDRVAIGCATAAGRQPRLIRLVAETVWLEAVARAP
eukprot:4666335-Alexandrium_andersonii.AAC.1